MSAVRDGRYSVATDRSLAVVVRAAVITVPGIVRVIIGRVVRVIARLWRTVDPGVGVIHVSAAANHKCQNDRADQRENCCGEGPTSFDYGCHERLGHSFETTPHRNASQKIKRIGTAAVRRAAPMRQPTARRELLPVAVNSSGVVAWPVGVIIANAGAYDGRIISWTVIVRIWITVVVRV